jgi:hypothetical protein
VLQSKDIHKPLRWLLIPIYMGVYVKTMPNPHIYRGLLKILRGSIIFGLKAITVPAGLKNDVAAWDGFVARVAS